MKSKTMTLRSLSWTKLPVYSLARVGRWKRWRCFVNGKRTAGFRLARRPIAPHQAVRGGAWYCCGSWGSADISWAYMPEVIGNHLGLRLARRPR